MAGIWTVEEEEEEEKEEEEEEVEEEEEGAITGGLINVFPSMRCSTPVPTGVLSIPDTSTFSN